MYLVGHSLLSVLATEGKQVTFLELLFSRLNDRTMSIPVKSKSPTFKQARKLNLCEQLIAHRFPENLPKSSFSFYLEEPGRVLSLDHRKPKNDQSGLVVNFRD